MISTTVIFFALLGGFVPALLWLWFWLTEDREHPEPKRMIALAFLVGCLTVLLVLPFQKVAFSTIEAGLPLIIALAIIEEIMKAGIALMVVLWRKDIDEPVDQMVYMVTVALGFAALENMLYLLNPLSGGYFIESIVTGNLRFLGSTLLHVLASGVVGLALARAFYAPHYQKVAAWILGVILATLLHVVFNFSILQGDGSMTLIVFGAVWIGIIGLIFFFEDVKRLAPQPRTQHGN